MQLSDFNKIFFNKESAYYLKQIGDYFLYIYVGKYGLQDNEGSFPYSTELDLYDYNYVAITISSSVSCPDAIGEAFFRKEFKIDFPLTFSRYELNFRASFIEVKPQEVEKIYEAIMLHEKLEIPKVEAGSCIVCNISDSWNSVVNGKSYCYKHLPGY